MKNLFVLLLLPSIFFFSCSDSTEEDKAKIIDLLYHNAECYRSKNLDCIMSTYLNDSSVIALGTERNFIGRGWDAIRNIYKSDLSQNWTMIKYEYRNPIINIHQDVSWLSADVYSKIEVSLPDEYNEMQEIELELDSRLTAVCKKVDGEWKFVLTNFQHFKNPAEVLVESK
ncbi:MAG: nuclear transport factor 2 family protein [bacterium]